MKKLLTSLLLASLFTGCAISTIKQTSISAAQSAGFGVANYALKTWPNKAPAVIADVQVLLTDALTRSAPLLPSELTAWEANEAAKLNLPASDVQALDSLIQTGIVALQAQYQADVKAGLGVTATAILTNFNAGLAQATSATK